MRDSPQNSAIRAVVHGRVQGVGFRDYVRNRARYLRLDGVVRNLPDGRSVEIIAEGSRETLEQFAEYLRAGPRMSLVDTVDVESRPATGEYDDFSVIH